MHTETREIIVDETTEVSSVWAVPDGFVPGRSDALVIAHGAGNDMHSPFLSFVHETLARAGLLTVKFNFPYKEAGKRAPDPAARLELTYRAVLARVREDAVLRPRRVFAGGKSMGGRMASHLAAQGEAVDGLVFLGYPLHPSGKPDKLRADHLTAIGVPMLFIQGSRDPLCRLDLLDVALKPVKAPCLVHVIEGGDHSFKVLKRLGRTEQEVWREIVDTVLGWVREGP